MRVTRHCISFTCIDFKYKILTLLRLSCHLSRILGRDRSGRKLLEMQHELKVKPQKELDRSILIVRNIEENDMAVRNILHQRHGPRCQVAPKTMALSYREDLPISCGLPSHLATHMAPVRMGHCSGHIYMSAPRRLPSRDFCWYSHIPRPPPESQTELKPRR